MSEGEGKEPEAELQPEAKMGADDEEEEEDADYGFDDDEEGLLGAASQQQRQQQQEEEEEEHDEEEEEEEEEEDAVGEAGQETALVPTSHGSQQHEGKEALPSEITDPKVMEFLRILDEYRLKCEDEGNYEEAERASKQLDNLRKQEMRRQVKALKARQISEKQDIQIAHNMQFAEFNAAWDKYMQEYDAMGQQYIKQMTERHAAELRDYQESMQRKMQERPPKFSKELLEWRRRQHMLAKQKNYAMAQKIKRTADMMEAKERSKIDTDWQSSFASKESKFRARQQAELGALLKRIDVRRKEHLAQRNLDSKRLLQRNRNVQSVLDSKQTVEERLAKSEIKTRLTRPRNGVFGAPAAKPKSRAIADRGSPKAPRDLASDSTFLTG